MIIIFTLVIGLIIGSFLSVCIYRIPYGRKEEWLEGQQHAEQPSSMETQQPDVAQIQNISIANPPRSFCPKCNNQLRWYHNIPLFSWLALGGRCAFCKAPISVRYPLVDLLSALFAVLSVSHFGLSATALLIYIFCCALIVISFIDYDYYIIPNLISLPGLGIALALAVANEIHPIFSLPIVPGIKSSLLGVLAGGGFLLLVSEGYLRLRKKEGLGMGDVKLLAMTGALFGVEGALYTIFVGSILGSVLGVFFILLARRNMSHQLPFGPYLALGTIIYIFIGPKLIPMVFDLFTGGV